MAKFLSESRAKATAQTERDRVIYRDMVAKCAERGDLEGADATAATAAMKSLGIVDDQFDSDVLIVKELGTLTPIAADLEPRRTAHKEAGRELNAGHAAFAEKYGALQAELARLDYAKYVAGEALAEAGRAQTRLADIRLQRPYLFAPAESSVAVDAGKPAAVELPKPAAATKSPKIAKV